MACDNPQFSWQDIQLLLDRHPSGVKTKDKAGRTPLVAAACRDVSLLDEDDEYDLEMIRLDVICHLFRRSPSDGIAMARRLLGDDDVRLPRASCSRVTSRNKKGCRGGQ